MSTENRIGSLRRVGIIGSGQIGPDIALHFAKVLNRSGAAIDVVDIDEGALERGREKLRRKVSKGVDSGAFKPEMGEAMIGSVTFSNEYDRLRDADLIVEAATEDRDLLGTLLPQQFDDSRKEVVVSSREDRQGDGVHIFLDRRVHDHLGCLMQTGIDHLVARISEGSRDDLGPTVVTIEAHLAHQHTQPLLLLTHAGTPVLSG